MNRKQTETIQAVLLIGAPGAGKGTQGETLGALPGFFHCASGDIFRALGAESELGKKIAAYSDQGALVPNEITMEVVSAQLGTWVEKEAFCPAKEILILDGIPRNVGQAELLKESVSVERVIHLSCPDRDALVSRMQKRAREKGRSDDADVEVIRRRFEVYEAETKPILEFYGDQRITTIDAQRHPIEVMHEIAQTLIESGLYKTL